MVWLKSCRAYYSSGVSHCLSKNTSTTSFVRQSAYHAVWPAVLCSWPCVMGSANDWPEWCSPWTPVIYLSGLHINDKSLGCSEFAPTLLSGSQGWCQCYHHQSHQQPYTARKLDFVYSGFFLKGWYRLTVSPSWPYSIGHPIAQQRSSAPWNQGSFLQERWSPCHRVPNLGLWSSTPSEESSHSCTQQKLRGEIQSSLQPLKM